MRKGEWRLVAVRGATTVEADTPEQVRERTSEVLREIMDRNDIRSDAIVSIIFTTTPDIVSEFPAAAARGIGLSQVPLLCSQEIPVASSVEKCIRVLMHTYSLKPRDEIRHAYLRGGRHLREDLPE